MSYLTAQDIANELKVPLRTAYTYAQAMRHLKIGRNVRVTRAAFEAWKREHECRATSGQEESRGSSGRTSTGAASRRAAHRSDSLARGRMRDSFIEPIHVSQPRRERA
jgi:excisionase family DNA binding protein